MATAGSHNAMERRSALSSRGSGGGTMTQPTADRCGGGSGRGHSPARVLSASWSPWLSPGPGLLTLGITGHLATSLASPHEMLAVTALPSPQLRRPSAPPDSADDPRSAPAPSSASWAPGACGPNHCLYEPPPLDSSTQGIADSFKKGKGEAFKDTYSLFSSEQKRGWKTVTLRTTWGAWST